MARVMKDSGIEWIGEIPKNWTISRVKYVSDFEPGCNRDGLNDESVITYTPMDCIKNGWFINNTATLGSVTSSLTSYQNGDIVMAKVTPCFENGNIAIMENLASGYGLGSSELFVFRPINIDTRYFFYWLQNPMFVQLACSTMTGTGGLKRVSPYFAKNCYIHQPPLGEQHRIADFLDRKCAEIDAVIEKTKATIEEYKKLKQSVITEAVTKGIRGNRPMKDSGVEMIGVIPSEWTCTRVSRIATVVRGGSPRPAGDSRFFNGNYIPWITVAEVTNTIGHYIISTETCLTEEGAKCSRIVDAGTLLLSNSGATLGVPKITNIRGCINDGSVAFYNLEIDKMYLLYVFASYTEELRKQRQGYGQPNLNTDIIKALYIPLPPTYEQNEIVVFLDKMCADLDNLIAKKNDLLTELETYKKSLIYEYVTGKKEVL